MYLKRKLHLIYDLDEDYVAFTTIFTKWRKMVHWRILDQNQVVVRISMSSIQHFLIFWQSIAFKACEWKFKGFWFSRAKSCNHWYFIFSVSLNLSDCRRKCTPDLTKFKQLDGGATLIIWFIESCWCKLANFSSISQDSLIISM